MPVAVANVDVVGGDSFQDWIDRTNEAITAIRNLAVTTNSNTATGNAIVNGSFEATSLAANSIGGGTLALPAALTFTTNVTFSANVDLNGSRTFISGNKIWHAGNDGSGTGLDADTLDGQHLSVLARTDVPTTFAANVEIDGVFTANTANVVSLAIGGVDISSIYAPKASPTFTGTPGAPTPANTVSNTQIATTAFVQNVITPLATKASPTLTGTVTVTGNVAASATVSAANVASTGNTSTVNLLASANVYANNVIATNDVSSGSDIKMKDNIHTINDSLEIITSVRGVRFNWKANKEPSLGVIAQEVEQILPELVHDNGAFKTVTYNGLIAVLIEAVKQLNARVLALESSQ